MVVASEPEQPVNVLTAGKTWSYYFQTAAPAAGWTTPGFDASAWATGAAPLGWGHTNLGTTLTFSGTKPLTSYYRSTFNVQNASGVESMTLTTRADDGIVVYVNGVEVGRSNLPAGAIGHNTYATSATTAAAALANPVTYTVSGALLQTGQNVITAEVHSNYRTTPSASFELTGVLGLGTQPQPDNTAPVITLLGANPLQLTVGDVYSDPGATAIDNVDGVITASIDVGGDTVTRRRRVRSR